MFQLLTLGPSYSASPCGSNRSVRHLCINTLPGLLKSSLLLLARVLFPPVSLLPVHLPLPLVPPPALLLPLRLPCHRPNVPGPLTHTVSMATKLSRNGSTSSPRITTLVAQTGAKAGLKAQLSDTSVFACQGYSFITLMIRPLVSATAIVLRSRETGIGRKWSSCSVDCQSGRLYWKQRRNRVGMCQ